MLSEGRTMIGWMGGVFYGWWIVVTGFTINVLTTSLLMSSFGAYFVPLQQQFGWSKTALSGAFTLARTEGGLLGPIQGVLIQRFGPRNMVWSGMFLFGVGFLLFSQINSIWAYYFTFCLMSLGASLGGFLTVQATVVNWFERRRAQAVGITQSGQGVGGLLVPIVAWSISTFEWGATAFYSGLVILAFTFPLGLLMRGTPEQHGLLPDGRDSSEASKGLGTPGVSRDVPTKEDAPEFTTRQAMHTSAFWLINAGHAAALVTVGAVMLHLIPYLVEEGGFTLQIASAAVTVMTAFSIMGQIGGGFLGGRINTRVLLVTCMFAHAGALIVLVFSTTTAAIFVFAALHGTAWGVRGPMMTTLRADYFGRRSFATIMGVSSLMTMVGIVLGPILGGYMADVFGSYRPGFLVIATITAVGSWFFAVASAPSLPVVSRATHD